jgi:hypothetical protein
MKNEHYDVMNVANGCHIKMWTRGVPVEDAARKQLANIARIPFIYKHVAVMPDVHLGKGSTIGSVIPTKGAIIPATVGVDIGCGMMACKTTLCATDLPDTLVPIRAAIEKAVPHGMSPRRGGRDKGSWETPPTQVDAWHVFLACHAGQALRLLADPSREEREILGALPYQRNEALLHTDTSLLPRRRRAWAAWNYHWLPGPRAGVALTYDMNVLQSLRSRHTLCVTLNAAEHVDERCVLRRMEYAHPLFTLAGAAAQRRHHEISGVRRTHYCGAYWRYGFHEDGVVSALQALARFEQACRRETIDAQRALSRVA